MSETFVCLNVINPIIKLYPCADTFKLCISVLFFIFLNDPHISFLCQVRGSPSNFFCYLSMNIVSFQFLLLLGFFLFCILMLFFSVNDFK